MSEEKLNQALKALKSIRDMPKMFVDGIGPGTYSWVAIGQISVEIAEETLTEIEGETEE